MLIARPRRRPTGDAGVTLAETVVGMGMSLLVCTLGVTWFVSAHTATATPNQAGLTTADARATLQSWSGLIQLADSSTEPGSSTNRITALAPTSITFNANLHGRLASCTTGFCTSGATTTVTLAMPLTSALPGATRQLTQKVGSAPATVLVPSGVSATTTCVFQPYSATGASLPCDNTRLSSVARIDITIALTPTLGQRQVYTSSAPITGLIS